MGDQGIILSEQDLREVARYAAESAEEVLELFEQVHPEDLRPRGAGRRWPRWRVAADAG